VGVVEVTSPLDSFDFSTASRWELLVLQGGEPVARVGFPSPGPVDSAELARELIWPHAEWQRVERQVGRRLLDRLGAPRVEPAAPPSCSVVVCTHGRPAHLAIALEALARLDPAPLEVIVVDNAPGERDCRDAVLAKGFTYVREDRKGLDNARNAGIRAARGDVIAFTDDDCVHPPGWLRHLGESFDDPLVAAVTAPAFPYRLDTPARVRMEQQASLTRGLRPRVLDWTLISPLHAGQAGVGANMAIRASLLRAVDNPFPPELDAGTETMSGGDTYLFARLLTAGHRIAYDPRGYVFHQHRPDWSALDRAVTGYGTGACAALFKLLVEDGELEAPRAAMWLVSQYLRTQVRRARGRADAVETRLAWAYLRGAFRGPRAWMGARRAQREVDPGLRAAPAFPPPTAAPASGRAPRRATGSRWVAVHRGAHGEPAISVIVPTVRRGQALARCLAALEAQTLPASAFEVFVVDDSPDEPGALPPHGRLVLHLHRTGGRGAAVARNEGALLARGELLLFLDDDLIAAPDLLERHIACHGEAPSDAVVIGYSPPRPPRPGLAALGAALWWEDQFRSMERSAALSFTDALSGNVSIRRSAFLDGRSFDPSFEGLRREDWEWGFRLLTGGARLRYEPEAVAAHEYELSAARRLRACRLEGRGDARLLERHPEAAPRLPLASHRPASWRRPLRRVTLTALGDPRADAFVVPVLDLLERAHLRSAWSSLYRRAQRASYAHGLRAAGWRPGRVPEPPLLEVELASEEPLPAPGPVAPRLRVTHEGRPVAEADPDGCRLRLVSQPNGNGHTSEPLRRRVTVLLGAGDDRERPALSAAGARVETLDGPRAGHWDRVVAAAAAADADLIAIPLPGRTPEPGWLAEVEPAFEAPRAVLAVGQALRPSSMTEPVTLHDRRPQRLPYVPLGGPVDYLVIRPEALLELRLAVARGAAYGSLAVAFACAEEVLASGRLVAHRNVHGLDPTDGRWAASTDRERAKLAAWGALLADHALAGPRLRGAAWLAGIAAGGLALGARRGSGAPAALFRGYAAALRRRGAGR
jgi:glycosyltransferase involved in cell wall biosynthesis